MLNFEFELFLIEEVNLTMEFVHFPDKLFEEYIDTMILE